jgi:hypothetical protein
VVGGRYESPIEIPIRIKFLAIDIRQSMVEFQASAKVGIFVGIL